MATNVTWNNTARSIPDAGEINWQALTGFLVDLGNNAQTTNFQQMGIRVATTTPVSMVAATDAIIVVDLTVPGASAVNLAAGSNGRVIVIVDGKGDAATNNITITPDGAETINGAASLVLNKNRQAVVLAFQGSNWSVVGSHVLPSEISHTEIQDIGTNSHAQIDNHIASTANPHSVGGSQLNGAVPITLGGTGQITKTAGFNALSPVTTKGDIITRNGTNNVRLPAGDNGNVLTADSAETSGLKWAASLANPMDDLGQLIKGGAAGAVQKFDHGAANTVLKTNAGATDLEYGLVTNDNVDAAAAISGTKIDPNFGTQLVQTTGNVNAASGVFTGAISGGQIQNNTTGTLVSFNVAGLSSIRMATNFGNMTIQSLSGGVTGQILHIAKQDTNNTLTINGGGAGTQTIHTELGTNVTFSSGNRGGCVLICSGSAWFMVGASR